MTPLAPNYKDGVGQLVTYRKDFQSHIEGLDFRHDANGIDLNPAVNVDGYTKLTVQDAIISLAEILTPSPPADATSSTKGILKLAGDLGGTADLPKVTKIQGKPVSTLPPSVNDVLIWNGATYAPGVPTNVFTPGGDLSGNNVSQQVVDITGTAGTSTIKCSNFVFEISQTPVITQQDNTFAGTDFTIQAQKGGIGGGLGTNGGNLILLGGNKTSSGKYGGVNIGTHNNNYVIQLTDIASNRRVLGLMNSSGSSITSTEMPNNTGDYVIYIQDAATNPTSGSPVGGTILYSSSGTLRVKQEDGSDFKVGELSNPNSFGTTNRLYSKRDETQTTGASPQSLFFTLDDDSTNNFEVHILGKEVGTNATYQAIYRSGYIVTSNTAVIIGSVTTVETRSTAGASGWTAPAITIFTGPIIQIDTGYQSGTTINWTVFTNIYTTVD